MKDLLELELTKKSASWIENIEALSKLSDTTNTEVNNSDLDIINTIGNLGFTNSRCIVERTKIIQDNIDFNNAVQRAVECISFILETRKYFGEGVVVIKREDMIKIMRKYNLICGDFSNYLGTIPEENVLEIKAVKDKIKKLKNDYDSIIYGKNKDEQFKLLAKAFTDYHLLKITGITLGWTDDRERKHKLNKKYLKDLNTLPLLLGTRSNTYYDPNPHDYVQMILPDDELKKINHFDTLQMENLFIIAPENEMNNRDKKITIRAFRPKTEDPLICSLTKEGVVVFSKWGKEAEDEAFNKYNQLFESLKLK